MLAAGYHSAHVPTDGAAMGTLSIPLSSEDEAVLHRIASVNRVTDSEAAAAGLHAYLKFESEQIAKIRAGLDAADRGEFVPEAEMEAFFAKHGAEN
jgi:predicted transcriptional regulator